MKSEIQDMGGAGPALLFAHANGYPPGSYQQLFDALGSAFAIRAIEHRPLWAGRQPPARLRWSLFADDLLAAVERHFSQPVWVMGHSMGATTALLAAVRAPQRFAGLVLLDPVFLPTRFVVATRLSSPARLKKMPLIRRTLTRPEIFDDLDSAFDFYRGKRAFRGLSDEALRNYVAASKQAAAEGGVQLRYSAAWEAAVYASPPRVAGLLKRLSVPTLGLRGKSSDTLLPEVWQRWAKWQPAATLRELPGGHLFPLENPGDTAKATIDYVFSR